MPLLVLIVVQCGGACERYLDETVSDGIAPHLAWASKFPDQKSATLAALRTGWTVQPGIRCRDCR